MVGDAAETVDGETVDGERAEGAPTSLAEPARGTPAELAGGVCVVGMRRSGTSLVAGALHHLGVYLGDEHDLRGPDGANPLGYWELPEISALNERVLAVVGSAEGSSPFDQSWEDSVELEELEDQARTLLRDRFAGVPKWGWKDPRNLLTLPFWQRLVEGMRYVICIRNPVDVAQSLRATQGTGSSLEPQMAEWVWSTALVLERTSGSPRVIVDYDDFLAEPEQEIASLARFVDLEDRVGEPEVQRSLERFVDPTLPLFRTPVDAVVEDRRATREAVALYRELRRVRRAGQAAAEPGGLGDEWDALEQLAFRLRQQAADVLGSGPAANERLADSPAKARGAYETATAAEVEQLEAEVELERARARELEAGQLRLRQQLEQREAELDERARRLAELEARLQERNRDATSLEALVAKSEERAVAGEQQLSELSERLERLSRDTAAAQEQAERAQAEAERERRVSTEREATIRRLEAKIEELQQIAARELEQVADRDERLLRSQTEVAELRGHTERLKAAVEERDARLEQQRQFIQEHREELHLREAQHQQLIQAMTGSRSWRVTRPMRRMAILVRRLTGRGDPNAKP
jgi:hypothetical protein